MSIRVVDLTERFKSDFKQLDPQLKNRVKDIIANQLIPFPIKGSLRHHTLNGHKPPIHVIDVTGNHAYQITFWIDGDVARLLRVDTHKRIDLNPGQP